MHRGKPRRRLWANPLNRGLDGDGVGALQVNRVSKAYGTSASAESV
jgi:hypothetical protein